MGYVFRPVNSSSSGLQQNKSKVLLSNWDPNTYSCKQYKIRYWINYDTYIILLKQLKHEEVFKTWDIFTPSNIIQYQILY